MAFKYTHLPNPEFPLKVGPHPDVSTNWCGYTPNTYTMVVFLKGIFRDVHMNTVTEAKARVTQPWLPAFLEDDPEAFLGDAFRHIEAGEIFPETYVDIDREGESLAPISGHHLNLITETDRTIEKWHIRISHNREDFARYFKDFSTFQQFMEILKGNMMKGIKKSLGIIVKAVMTSDPSAIVFDDKDIARIFGKTWDYNLLPNQTGQQPISSLGQKWQTMMQGLINKYSSKAREVWKNITWYNPYNFAFDNHAYEEMRMDDIYFPGRENKDSTKAQVQNIYTDTHTTLEDIESDREHHVEEGQVKRTKRLHDLHRNDCLFALVDAISKALNIINNEESPEFWLGNKTIQRIHIGDKKKYEEWKSRVEHLMTQAGQSLTGIPIETEGAIRSTDSSHDSATTASDDEAFEVSATPDNLILLLNPEDYVDLDIGIARRGQMDTRAVNLDMLRKYCNNIYPMRGMKAGFARLIDKRAFKIKSYFQMTDVQTPMEKLTWRYKTFYLFATTMFKNFAGTLFVPTPHFVASPRFYDKYGWIGQPVEDPLALHSNTDHRE